MGGNKKLSVKVKGLLLVLCLAVGMSSGVVYAEGTGSLASDDRKLKNGSFEEGQTWTGSYNTQSQDKIPSWNTTASDKQIELFRKNTGTYITGVTLEATEGSYAAELNANEESTLYQNVKTTPSSIYEWGLDHGARNGTDTMALVIGPKQTIDPSKPSKTGRDQFMQMVDWLIEQGMTSVKTSAGLGEKLTVYSKKFAANGTFEDNAGNNAFSLTPSTIYTEEWQIWIMASSRATSGTNPWNSYGSNSEGSAGSTGEAGSTEVDLSKYYLYTVPAGQTETLFGFVSVGYNDSATTADKAKTYGNFLDNINFNIYHPLSGSTTTHGSGIVGGSDGTTGGEGASEGHQVTVDNSLITYVTDGEPLRIQAVVKSDDADAGCEFVGLYYTVEDENGNPCTVFLQKSGNEIEDTGSLTDEEKHEKWVKSTNADGDTVYTYYLDEITSATDIHFVFIKSPTITYDPNGGKAYVVERAYNTDEAENVYSYKPASGNGEEQAGTATIFIDPYVSKAAEGQNDGWKFMGWLLTGDTVEGASGYTPVNKEQLGSLLLSAEHTVACDYAFTGVNGDSKAQYFKIYDENISLTKQINTAESGAVTGVHWEKNPEDTASNVVYANVHKGLTLVAQWRWRQAFIPQLGRGDTYTDSNEGGTVEITSVTDTSDENYNGAYNTNDGKSYHATTDETVTAEATANSGYIFVGWFDSVGNLVTRHSTLSYTETKESVNTYYARFSQNVTQTYIRQVKVGETWEDTTNDDIGTLGRYSYTDVVGTPISSTATAGTNYVFVGWYDSEGNQVEDGMLTGNRATISYTTTGDATYYARFIEKTAATYVTQTFIRQIKNGDTWENTTDNRIAILSRYYHIEAAGKSVSSTAAAGTGYVFVGWYDSEGNQVADSMLINDGKTISYTTIGDANYFARFEKTYTVKFEAQTEQYDGSFITNNVGGSVSVASATDVEGTTASSVATANPGATFLGWYDKDGNLLSENATYSPTITSTADGVTYYARFSKSITQTYVRQIKNGNIWEEPTDDNIAVLNRYTHTAAAGAPVSSTAAAGTGYKFVGWYDSSGNKVASGMLADNGTTISYTTTEDAIYYARFEKIVPPGNVSETPSDASDSSSEASGTEESTQSNVYTVDSTDTGDNSRIGLYAGLLLTGCLGIGLIILKKH